MLFLLFVGMASAQENLTGYWEPKFSVNYKVTGLYSHNFSLSNRNYLLDDGQFTLQGRQLDLAHFSKLKVRDNQSISVGVQYRFRNNFEDGENELRFTQQYNFTYRPYTIRFGHRISAEQRITQSLTTHRFRYRIALDVPLQGEKLDPGEPYFVGSLENLWSVSKGNSPQYDTRISSQIGWLIGKDLTIQLGLEYRFEDFTAVSPKNVIFLLTGAQLAL
ncbi:DUF2490 domain-containing protein [Allomuricauda sp. M10]|jgi:Protein of unknown function (DUF2490).|uniref:DUF2490 domain-containing protein n=1 Tax=Allomuricauda sp. M10 TaxID=2683292 RepID=UPI001D18BBE4|nr:DUF2490 domain-containing protein [Muricauda sp. M10]